MIAKATIGKSFGGCLSYCLNPKKKPEILYTHNCFGGRKDLTKQMKESAMLSRRVKKPVWHTTISFPLEDNDKIDNSKLIQITDKLIERFKLEKHQLVAIKHNDTSHQHIHIIINRVSLESGKAISTSHNYKKLANFSRKMEEEFNLKKVLNPKRFIKGEQKNLPRNDSRKVKLKGIIEQALAKCSSYPEFEKFVNKKGYEIHKGRGIAFIDNKKVRIKGSQVGYSLRKIESHLEKEIANQLQRQLTLTRKRNLNL